MSDSITGGMKAGIWATVGDAIIHLSAFFLLKTTTTAHYISQLVFPLKEVTLGRYLIGELVHFGAGSFGGIILALILQKYGYKDPYFKGVGLGIVFWVVHIAVIPNIVTTPRPILFRTELECLIDLLSHLVYGVILAFVLTRSNQKTANS